MMNYNELKKLIKIRLEAAPSNIGFSIGKCFSKEELLKEIENETEIGKLFIKLQLEYLRSMKNWYK